MEELEDNISTNNIKDTGGLKFKIKPKKRSLVERELETNLTERVTSPITYTNCTNTSRYGRARRLKTNDSNDAEKSTTFYKSPPSDQTPVKSPVYKMHASNSPIRVESPTKQSPNSLDHQIETIYSENISLSRFSSEKKCRTSAKKPSPKVYISKDLIQTKEKEESVVLIKNYSPSSNKKSKHLSSVLQRSSERFNLNNNKHNGYLDNSSVVKTLDFDGNRKKKNKETKAVSKSDLFEMEAKCEYQVGDLAWARMGTYPYWPCIVTRDPYSGMFVKKKLLGRADRDYIHVTFFGDNGRRSWILDNMLRKFLGQHEFETTRKTFTPEAKKKDPRCAAFFVSEKKQPQWTKSVDEAETFLKEPKRLRIDLLCDMLNKVRTVKTTPKGSKKLTRTDSDVSLSESLYDTLFCEDDSKINESERSKTKTRKKSFDVSQVVTACLDNMAAKTGIIKIQKQSHMDRWLQKAKSKTPEKSQFKSQSNTKPVNGRKRRKSKVTVESDNKKSYRLTLSDNESLNEVDYKLQAYQNDHDYSSQLTSNCIDRDILDESNENVFFDSEIAATGFGIITKVESLSDNDVSNKSLDGDLVISSDCIIGETTIIDSNNSLVEQDGVSILIINDVRSMQDDVASKIEIPAITSNLDECQKVTTSGSENILTEISNKKTDGENKAVVFSPKESILKNTDLTATTDSNNLQVNHSKIIEQMNTNISEIKNIQTITDLQPHLNNGYTENLNTCLNYTDVGPLNKVKPIFNKTDNIVEENVDTNYSKRLQNTNTTGNSVTNLTNGHIEDMENKKPVSGSKKTNAGQSNEESTENSRDCTFKNQDNVLCEENQGKQDVNIVKTILSDKLVGNIVDFNKTAFTIELNEMSTDKKITVNYDIDLTIPETNGHSNRTITDDCHDKETSSTYKYDDELKMLEDNSSSDSSNVTGNQESDKEVQSTFNNDNTLVSTVNSSCSNIFHGDSNQDTDSFETVNTDNESITSDTVKSNNDTGFVPNGTLTNDDSIESDSTLRNCDLSFSSDDDDRSNNSTPTNCDEFSIIEKRKIRLIRKLHKNITLQDALLLKDVVNGTNDIDERMASQKEMVYRIDGQDTCSREIIKANDEINSVYDKSHQSIGESIRRSKRYSMDSGNTSESDNKSANGEDLIKIPETSESLDVDESIERSENVTGNVIAHEHKVAMHADLGQEKVILSGDELRLAPHGLEVTDNCPKNDVNGDEICVEKVKEELRLTPHCLEEENYPKYEVKEEDDADTASIISTNSDISLSKRKAERLKAEKKSLPNKKSPAAQMDDPEFLKYMELKQDAIYEENPELSEYEITTYLYNTWLYEESLKTDRKKSDDIQSANMVKGLQLENVKPKKVKKRVKAEKETDCEPIKVENVFPKQKPKRRTPKASYNEEYSDIEEDLEVFRIPKPKELKVQVLKIEEYTEESNVEQTSEVIEIEEDSEVIDEVEEYFARLTEPKPNVFKGLLREKVCEICEKVDNLVKCKSCCCQFHIDCVKKETEVVEVQVPMKGRKKKKKTKGRKSKSDDNLDGSQSDERDVNVSEELVNTSMDNIEMESHIEANADDFEAQLAIKMKELIGDEVTYESSADELDWSDIEPGKCEVIDVKPRSKNDTELTDHSDFKCNNCQKYDVPVCFVCRSPESPKNQALHRQRCQVAQCNKYFHLECLEHWPQTQFNSGECARYNKEVNEYFEPLTCPRHVCHTCVSDDPRGCKTRFCGDKLARCVRCPATYHSFTKCLPAGSKILTGSHIICPRHVEHRPGKVPCHVNTGWCFICALGGTLICCEYCPTSFHAECLNIKPPEGGYMCEDCETGRLPLYGEMVWVKLGHYRWWPGIILHPCEIPENILAVKHSPGEFVVRFFGQYDHYWVNRGRVFPFQEGDTGKVSSQKSKIDAAFTMAIEHAQRACEILKTASPNEEESLDIASSLLPPHYVKLRVNKPCGALCARRVDEESSLTQCECSPHDDQPCGPYSHCLNRMLLTECGPTCRAGERCHNRAFEKRLYPKLTPYRTPHRGWGLKTLEGIKAGQFVIEYVGEVIDEEEFQRRMRRKHEIRDENYYFLTLDKERMIDAGPKGNLARFMNHCCEPNCETQKWTVLGDVRVGLFALYDIPANSEVTFNYNLESAGIEKKQCMCGAKRCSGYIGAKPKQMDQPKKPKRPYNKKKERKIDDSPSTSKTKPKTGKLGRPPKPKELTEIEKDLLIIKNATNSDSDAPSIDSRPLKRKRNGLSMEDPGVSVKKIKMVEESSDGCD